MELRDITYNPENKIGKGGFGTIYANSDSLVVKTIGDDHPEQRSKAFEEIIREAYVFTQLEGQPNITQAIALDIYHNSIEIERGITILSSIIKRAKSNFFKVDILYQIASAVKQMHSRQLIHFDIKPENIMIFGPDKSLPNEVFLDPRLYSQYRIKLIDFGCARQGGCGKYVPINMIGTFRYMAPEILRSDLYGRLINEKADIWSLGVTFLAFDKRIKLIPTGLFTKDEEVSVVRQKIYDYIYEQRGPSLQIENTWRSLVPTDLLFHDLIIRMLDVNPVTRLTIEEVLIHPFFNLNNHPKYPAYYEQISQIVLSAHNTVEIPQQYRLSPLNPEEMRVATPGESSGISMGYSGFADYTGLTSSNRSRTRSQTRSRTGPLQSTIAGPSVIPTATTELIKPVLIPDPTLTSLQKKTISGTTPLSEYLGGNIDVRGRTLNIQEYELQLEKMAAQKNQQLDCFNYLKSMDYYPAAIYEHRNVVIGNFLLILEYYHDVHSKHIYQDIDIIYRGLFIFDYFYQQEEEFVNSMDAQLFSTLSLSLFFLAFGTIKCKYLNIYQLLVEMNISLASFQAVVETILDALKFKIRNTAPFDYNTDATDVKNLYFRQISVLTSLSGLVFDYNSFMINRAIKAIFSRSGINYSGFNGAPNELELKIVQIIRTLNYNFISSVLREQIILAH